MRICRGPIAIELIDFGAHKGFSGTLKFENFSPTFVKLLVLILSTTLCFIAAASSQGYTNAYTYGDLHDQYYSAEVDSNPSMLDHSLLGDT